MPSTSLAALEARWHEEIPISATMGIRVHRFDGELLEVGAALAPNRNIHGTAFAGSQFSIAALCGWGQVFLQLNRAGSAGSIVFVDGQIRCLAPVRDDMVARCTWTELAETQLAMLADKPRTRIQLAVEIESGGTRAADFSGEYAIRAD